MLFNIEDKKDVVSFLLMETVASNTVGGSPQLTFTVTNKEHQLDQAVNQVIGIIETESLKKPTREIRL